MNNTIQVDQIINNRQKALETSKEIKEKLLSLSMDDKLMHLDSIRVRYPKLQEILEEVKECHQSTKISERPLCMRISGPSGSGKSNIYKLYHKNYPDVETKEGKEKPILYSRIECPAHIGGLAIKILISLGDEIVERQKDKKIIYHTHRLFNLLRDCKVKLIFLDEVQHLVDRNRDILIRDSSDWFKGLIDETKIPVIFLGMPDSKKIFTEHEQLSNRVRLVEELKPFQYDDGFIKFLDSFDMLLPLKDLSGLAEADLSLRIFKATNGLIKHIADLIVESTKIALELDCSRISIHMLERAYDKFFYSQLGTNPFSL